MNLRIENVPKFRLEHLRILTRRIWGTIFTLVIAAAVVIQLGRQAFPMITDYRDEITQYIENKIGMKVEVEEIQSEWSGLRPKIGLGNVRVISEDGVVIFNVENASAQLSIIDSIFKGRLSWRQLKFDGFETSLVQDDDGSWSIHGAPKFTPLKQTAEEDSAAPIIDDPYDLFLFGRRISITNAHFFVQFDSGKVVDIQIPQISLENDKNFHRLIAKLDVEEGEEAFQLVVEGQGDPRDENFTSNGFLELRNFSTTKVIEALGGKIAGNPVEVNKEEENKLNVALWFRGAPGAGMTIRGSVEAQGFPFSLPEEKYNPPQSVRTELVGKLHRQKGWDIGLRQLQVKWSEVQSSEFDVQITGGKDKRTRIRTPQLKLEEVSQLIQHFGIEGEKNNETIDALDVHGTLENIDVELTGKEQGYFLAKAHLQAAKSGAVMGIPAFNNVSGTLQFSMLEGSIDLRVDDGFSLHLPKVYHDPLSFEQASGKVSWKVDLQKRIAYVRSNTLTVTNPEEQGKGYLFLSLPFNKETGEQEMTLAIAIEETLAAHHKRYVPKTVPKHLYNWLDSSIKQGSVKNVRFLYSGSVEKDPYPKPTVQLYAEVYDGNLIFDPKWPALEGVSGILRLENNELDVQINKATLLGNRVRDANISVVKDEQGRSNLLSITGGVYSDVESAVSLLKSSPIREHIGSTFDNWQVSGGVSAKVALLIPLSEEAEGLSHKIDVQLSKANLRIPEVDLDIKRISGDFHYETTKGIYAKQLKTQVWGETILSSITSPRNASGGFDTRINFQGPVAIEKLREWTKRPELKFAEGKSEVSGSLTISQGEGRQGEKPQAQERQTNIALHVASNLQGVKINLPAPFAKNAESKQALSGNILFANNSERYEFLYGDDLRVMMLSDEYFSISSVIELGKMERRPAREVLTASGRFDIKGSISTFDLDQWNNTLDQYLQYSAEMLGEADDFEPTPAKLNVAIDKFFLGSFAIDELRITGERKWPYWELHIDSQLMAGLVRVSEEDAPIELDLDYIKIEADDEGEEIASEEESTGEQQSKRESVLADLDLSRAVPLKFSAKQFVLGEEDFGSWNFDLQPVEHGIAVNNIRAKVKNMRIGESGLGANFLWMKDGNKHSSQFIGTIRADDLADVFSAWGQEELLESQSARIDIDAQWPAAPDEVTLKTVKGLIILDVAQGSFNRGAGSDENALLRLLALFNFDTILRRLRLDFADLAAAGFSYDKVYGSLNFEDGNIYLTEPMIVESSSSVIQVAGTIDVVNEKLDTEMVITLPFASNLAVATAVVAGLPTAVGIYLMGKMFKNQVDKASSLNLQVRGKWEEPKIKISKIFDLDAANRKGRELEQKAKHKVSPEFHDEAILENELEQRFTPIED